MFFEVFLGERVRLKSYRAEAGSRLYRLGCDHGLRNDFHVQSGWSESFKLKAFRRMLRTRVLGRGTDSLRDPSWHSLTWHVPNEGSPSSIDGYFIDHPLALILSPGARLADTTIQVTCMYTCTCHIRNSSVTPRSCGSCNLEIFLPTEEYSCTTSRDDIQ